MNVIKMEMAPTVTLVVTRHTLRIITGMCCDALENNFVDEKEEENLILKQLYHILDRLSEYEYESK
jgi:hypothetical protein